MYLTVSMCAAMDKAGSKALAYIGSVVCPSQTLFPEILYRHVCPTAKLAVPLPTQNVRVSYHPVPAFVRRDNVPILTGGNWREVPLSGLNSLEVSALPGHHRLFGTLMLYRSTVAPLELLEALVSCQRIPTIPLVAARKLPGLPRFFNDFEESRQNLFAHHGTGQWSRISTVLCLF
jgi:hypothetical protein